MNPSTLLPGSELGDSNTAMPMLKSIATLIERKFSDGRASDIQPKQIEELLQVIVEIKNSNLVSRDNKRYSAQVFLSLEDSCYAAISYYKESDNRSYYQELRKILEILKELLLILDHEVGSISIPNGSDLEQPDTSDAPNQTETEPEKGESEKSSEEKPSDVIKAPIPEDEDQPIETPSQKKPTRKPRKKQDTSAPSAKKPDEPPVFLEVDKPPRTDSDRPSGQDQLNYEQYAQAFARIILNHETSTPLTIGIYGQWGQGKSFLMGKIREALKKQHDMDQKMLAEQHKKSQKDGKHPIKIVDYNIVEFNAWSYVGTDHLWAGLVTRLYDEAEKYFGVRAHAERLWQAAKKSLPKSFLIFAFYGLLGLGISLLIDYNSAHQSWDNLQIIMNTFWGSVLGGSALASLPVLWKTLTELMDNLFSTRAKSLQGLAAKPDFRSQIGIMADIKKEISFIGSLLKKGKQGHPTRFVLFIDDLDRCEHHKAVEVLQAIMLLLTDEDSAPFVIFLGIDARVLVRGIEATYGPVLVNAGINGYEYLDKIVQIPFAIPGAPKEVIKGYVDSMLWSFGEKELLEKRTHPLAAPSLTHSPLALSPLSPTLSPMPMPGQQPPEEVSVTFTRIEHEAIEKCIGDLSDNPRKIKRIINIYRFARLLLSAEINRPMAIRWFLMTEQWPLHVAWILEAINNDMETKKQLNDKSILDVFALMKEHIHSDVMETLLSIDADPDHFENFVRVEPVMTVQDIKTLLPYTFNLNPAIRSEVSKQALKLTEPAPQPAQKPRRAKAAAGAKKNDSAPLPA